MSVLVFPNILTAGRLVLFGFFIAALWYERTGAATIFFALAWGLDAVDGWLARRLHQETRFGYTFDKAVDRLVIAGGLLLLVLRDWLPLWSLWVLAKDVLLIPAALQHWRRGERMTGLGWPGKLISVLQGVSILWLLGGWPGGAVLVVFVAAGGILAAGNYYLHHVGKNTRL
jgi:phosphatidylglycerophosphate synthase